MTSRLFFKWYINPELVNWPRGLVGVGDVKSVLRLDSTATDAQSEEEAGLRENGNQYQREITPHSDGEEEK